MRLFRRLFPLRSRTAAGPAALTLLEQRMHDEFVRPDFLDRLAMFHGLGPDDVPTREHFAAFDAHRRAEHQRALEAEHEPGPSARMAPVASAAGGGLRARAGLD